MITSQLSTKGEEGLLRLEEPINDLGEHGGWGLGLAVPAAGSSDQPLPYGIGWDGGIGTTWRSNPRSGVTGILFTQREATSPAPTPLVEDFWAGVNAAPATH